MLEARHRTGGRILSAEHNEQCRFDMGPAWVWHQLQPRLQQLITYLNLTLFNQFITGDILYEKSPTDIERYSGPSSHGQSYRIAGGNQSLIEACNRIYQKNAYIYIPVCNPFIIKGSDSLIPMVLQIPMAVLMHNSFVESSR